MTLKVFFNHYDFMILNSGCGGYWTIKFSKLSLVPVQLIERLRNCWHMYWHMTTLFLKGIVTHHSAFGIDWLCSLMGKPAQISNVTGKIMNDALSLSNLCSAGNIHWVEWEQLLLGDFFFFQTNPCSLCNYRVKKYMYTDSHWTTLVVYCWSYARKPFFQCHCLS